MLITDIWHAPTVLSLGVIAVCLGVAITVSWKRAPDEVEPEPEPETPQLV
jgi:hypothetical protein